MVFGPPILRLFSPFLRPDLFSLTAPKPGVFKDFNHKHPTEGVIAPDFPVGKGWMGCGSIGEFPSFSRSVMAVLSHGIMSGMAGIREATPVARPPAA